MKTNSKLQKFIYQTVIAVSITLSVTAAPAAIFDDGNDRHFIKELRAKALGTLTDEEKAILAAASKVGQASLCDDKIWANAYLIRFDDRPAVVIAAHWLFRLQGGIAGNAQTSDGTLNCDPASVAKAWYYPNASYYERSKNNRDGFADRKVHLIHPPLNFETFFKIPINYGNYTKYGQYKYGHPDFDDGSGTKQDLKSYIKNRDFLIYFLSEDVTKDTLPDGEVRGSLDVLSAAHDNGEVPTEIKFDTKIPEGYINLGATLIYSPKSFENSMYMIGFSPDFGKDMIFQRGCNYHFHYGTSLNRNEYDNRSIKFDCDVEAGSSGNALLIEDGGELKLRGHAVAGLPTWGADSCSDVFCNSGLSGHVFKDLQGKPRPSLASYDIQWVLTRSGCYSGKLDNQWGPASRKALATFADATGIALPGNEPNPKLLTAVKTVAGDGRKVCLP